MQPKPDVLTIPATPLLEMRGINKSFPGVHALRGVDLTLDRGEVLALLGENGAGKSTLIKTLSGAHQPDSGQIIWEGVPLEIDSPQAAQLAGIGVIYQEFNLIPTLTAAANIFLGKEATRAGLIDRHEEVAQAAELFKRLGVEIDPTTPCHRLTIAQQQIVEIAKVLRLDARMIVMDEPSATLTRQEVSRLFEVIREVQARGIGVIYISHRLEEIYDIADRVCVLRDGQCVGDRPIDKVNRNELIELMVGRQLNDEFPPRAVDLGAVRLRVDHLARGEVVRDVSFEVRAGEVLALTGLIGAGRTEMARLIFGADQREAGEIWLDGRNLDIRTPREAIREGIALLTEDRKMQGLVLAHSVQANFGLPNLSWLSRRGFIRRSNETKEFGKYVDSLQIKIHDPSQTAQTLSGGNQQKVVLAKWLAGSCEVLIFDEPTRGIDVGAKYEIYRLINQLASQGKCIIMISSELPEVLGMADRIIVMHGGRITGEIGDVKAATQEQIMDLAVS